MYYIKIPEGWVYDDESKSLVNTELPEEVVKIKAIVNGHRYQMPIHDFEISSFTPMRGIPFVSYTEYHTRDSETQEVKTEDIFSYCDGETNYPSITRSKGFGR
jgi:hypothetical protein